MRKTNVKIEFYKKTGKYICEETFDSEFEPYNRVEIEEEIADRYDDSEFIVVETKKGLMWNKWIVTN